MMPSGLRLTSTGATCSIIPSDMSFPRPRESSAWSRPWRMPNSSRNTSMPPKRPRGTPSGDCPPTRQRTISVWTRSSPRTVPSASLSRKATSSAYSRMPGRQRGSPIPSFPQPSTTAGHILIVSTGLSQSCIRDSGSRRPRAEQKVVEDYGGMRESLSTSSAEP